MFLSGLFGFGSEVRACSSGGFGPDGVAEFGGSDGIPRMCFVPARLKSSSWQPRTSLLRTVSMLVGAERTLTGRTGFPFEPNSAVGGGAVRRSPSPRCGAGGTVGSVRLPSGLRRAGSRAGWSPDCGRAAASERAPPPRPPPAHCMVSITSRQARGDLGNSLVIFTLGSTVSGQRLVK